MGEGRRDTWSGSSRLGSVQGEAPGDPGRTTDVPRESWLWTEATPRIQRGHHHVMGPLLGKLAFTLSPPTYTPTHGTRHREEWGGSGWAQTKGPHPQRVEPQIQPAEQRTLVLTSTYSIKMKRERSLRIILRLKTDQSSRKVKDETDILVRFTVTPSSPTEPNEGNYSRKIREAPPSPTTKQDKTKTTSRGSSGSHYLPRTSNTEPATCWAYSRCHLSLPLKLLICWVRVCCHFVCD